jgi:hypothetical protein
VALLATGEAATLTAVRRLDGNASAIEIVAVHAANSIIGIARIYIVQSNPKWIVTKLGTESCDAMWEWQRQELAGWKKKNGTIVLDEGISGLHVQTDDATVLAERILEIALPRARREASDVDHTIGAAAAHLSIVDVCRRTRRNKEKAGPLPPSGFCLRIPFADWSAGWCPQKFKLDFFDFFICWHGAAGKREEVAYMWCGSV